MNPTERLNKRKVFSDNSEEEVEKSPKKKSKRSNKQHKVCEPNSANQAENFPSEVLSKNNQECANREFFLASEYVVIRPKYWQFLTVRGPYTHVLSQLNNAFIKNRPLNQLIRRILNKIHENMLEFRDNELPSIINPRQAKSPTIDEVMTIVEKMCRKVLCIRIGGISVDFHKRKTISLLRDVFTGKSVVFPCENRLDIYTAIESLCAAKNVKFVKKDVKDVRNALVDYCNRIPVDFLRYILVTKRDNCTGVLEIKSFHVPKSFAYDEKQLLEDPKLLDVSVRSSMISNTFLKRDTCGSLWMTLPCEEKEHVLDWVFEYGLIEKFPDNAKLFLIDWILNVRHKMREILKNGSLRKTVSRILFGSSEKQVMTLDDERIERFLVEIMNHVLNTEHFPFFKGVWMQYSIDSIKKMKQRAFGSHPKLREIFREVCLKMNPPAFARISSYFDQSNLGKALFSHTLLQLLRFVLHLSLSTLRHVFHFDSDTGTLTYDGEFDEEVRNFRYYDQQKSGFVISELSPVPSTSSVHNNAILPKKTFRFTPVSVPISLLPCFPAGCDMRHPPPFSASPQIQHSSQPNNFQTSHSPQPFNFTTPNSLPSLNSTPVRVTPVQSNIIIPRKTLLPTPGSPVRIPIPEASQSPMENKSFIRKFPSDSTNGTHQSPSNDNRISSVANGTQWNIDDETDIPKKWVDAYKIMLEWNQDLQSELEKAQAKLALLS